MANMLKVCKKVCKNCLFSKNKIVSDQRKEQILKDCENSFFICHCSSIEGKNENVCCRSYYTKFIKPRIPKELQKHLVSFVSVPSAGEIAPYSDFGKE